MNIELIKNLVKNYKLVFFEKKLVSKSSQEFKKYESILNFLKQQFKINK